MEIIRAISEMHQVANDLRCDGKRIGFVPTMGYLHEGHLSLLDRAREQSDVIVMSVFVNPKQFGPNEDYSAYPRDFQRDEALARDRGCDIMFYPSEAEIYSSPFHTTITVSELTARLCGASRPGHFEGVTTVVTKLFNIVRPHIAVFGQKDAQQGIVVRQLARDLNLDIEIVLGAIIREPDGLAMSSRNAYLTPAEREDARVLHKSLVQAEALFESGETAAEVFKTKITEVIATAPSAKIDYVELVDSETLRSVTTAQRHTLIALAVWIGKTRLIDNSIL